MSDIEVPEALQTEKLMTLETPVIVVGETLIFDKVLVDNLSVSMSRDPVPKISLVLLFRLYAVNSAGNTIFEEHQRRISISDYDSWALERFTNQLDSEAKVKLAQSLEWVNYLIANLGDLAKGDK